MYRLTFTIHPDDEDDLVTQLSGMDLAGISQFNRDDGQMDLIAWFDTQGAAELAGRVRHGSCIEEVAEENWNATWQATWQPIEVGERWYLVPPDDASETPNGRIRLELKPGLAFGNGDHPTTHLCLIAMEQLVQRGDTFLDVGCGSGLLGEAAEHLGATALGCDLARTDLPKNAFQGSLDAVKSGSIDVAVMNIQAGILEQLWPELARVTRRHAILSGFLPEQAEQIQALVQPPWRALELTEKDGWCALSATQSADPDRPSSVTLKSTGG